MSLLATRTAVGISLLLAVYLLLAGLPTHIRQRLPPADERAAGHPDQPDAPVPGSAWHPPRASALNNLTAALGGDGTEGAYGFVYSGSANPAGVPYGTYNWCNMPHVRRAEYAVPPAHDYRLRYVEVVQRHHKRTPYAANGFPREPYEWACDARVRVYGEGDDKGQKTHGSTFLQPTFDGSNPFVAAAPGWRGAGCQFPQLTAGGLADAWQHGADLYDVYHGLLGFLPAHDDDDAAAWRDRVVFRVTNNPITSQTASMVWGGMTGGTTETKTTADLPLTVEPPGFDALEPQYACPAAARLWADMTGGAATAPAWAAHLQALHRRVFPALDAASGVDRDDDRGFHASIDHYYDSLSARQCHGRPAVAGVSADLRDAVFRLGQWEYSRLYRDDARSLAASVGAWGVWPGQLADHLRAAATLKNDIRYRHNVAHDGSLSRLLSILQADAMVWPGMGSEVVVELWEATDSHEAKVRVLFGGRVLQSSHPALGRLDMVPLDALLAYLDDLVGPGASRVPELCKLE